METTTKTELETTRDTSAAKLNDHDAGVAYRLRQKMNNKNYKQWDDHWTKFTPVDDNFQNFKIEATQWNEPMLTIMHKSIRLEGRPKHTIPSGQPPTDRRRRNTKVTKDQ